jgi:polysaccharide pyruvyl transferase WcaK-like protein
MADKINEKEYRGIAVHGPSGAKINHFLSRVCDEYIGQTGCRVKLFCFDAGTQADNKAAVEVLFDVKHKEMVEIVENSPDYRFIIEQMATCCRILAVRFHAAILSVSLGIPFLAISYSNKMSNFLSDIGKSGKERHVSDVANIDARLFVKELIDEPVIPDAAWLNGADEHLRKFKEFLKGLEHK